MTCKSGLSVARIRALRPKAKAYQVTDSRGLRLEVSPRGLMSWRFRFEYRGRIGLVNIGRYPAMTLAAARKRRDDLLEGIRLGSSPLMSGLTVKQFGDKYLTDVVSKERRDVTPMRRYLERDVYPAIGRRPIASITQHDLRQIVFARRDAGHKQSALALYHLLKRLWNYALACGAAEVNPLHAVPAKFVGSAHSRERALSRAELIEFLKALDAAHIKKEIKTALELILLTLVRKTEMRLADWKEFNLDAGEWEIPPEHDKMRRGMIVYLSRQARKLLSDLRPHDERTGCVFSVRGMRFTAISASTLNKALSRLPININHFTVHDLRRTASTRLAELGWDQRYVEKALNHKMKGVAGVYNRAEYAQQRREMLQAWADWLSELRSSAESRQV